MLENVVVSFGQTPVLSVPSAELAVGSCLCVTGRNGSGKSTLLRLVTGLLQPTSGSVTVFGCRPDERSSAFRRDVAALLAVPPMAPLMRSGLVLVGFLATGTILLWTLESLPVGSLLLALGVVIASGAVVLACWLAGMVVNPVAARLVATIGFIPLAIYSSLKRQPPAWLQTPIVTPMGDQSAVLVLLWQLDFILLVALAGIVAFTVISAPTVTAGLGLVVVAIWLLLGTRRRFQRAS